MPLLLLLLLHAAAATAAVAAVVVAAAAATAAAAAAAAAAAWRNSRLLVRQVTDEAYQATNVATALDGLGCPEDASLYF
jgi:hypothetical protein